MNKIFATQTYFSDKKIYKVSYLSMSVYIDALGISNFSLVVNKEGYLQTNILSSTKTFYLGKDKVNEFVEYVFKNIPAKETIYV